MKGLILQFLVRLSEIIILLLLIETTIILVVLDDVLYDSVLLEEVRVHYYFGLLLQPDETVVAVLTLYLLELFDELLGLLQVLQVEGEGDGGVDQVAAYLFGLVAEVALVVFPQQVVIAEVFVAGVGGQVQMGLGVMRVQVRELLLVYQACEVVAFALSTA